MKIGDGYFFVPTLVSNTYGIIISTSQGHNILPIATAVFKYMKLQVRYSKLNVFQKHTMMVDP